MCFFVCLFFFFFFVVVVFFVFFLFCFFFLCVYYHKACALPPYRAKLQGKTRLAKNATEMNALEKEHILI